ncbi:MAG: hypothetical protein ABEJ48_07725, partial [Halobacteriales archaeon]
DRPYAFLREHPDQRIESGSGRTHTAMGRTKRKEPDPTAPTPTASTMRPPIGDARLANRLG